MLDVAGLNVVEIDEKLRAGEYTHIEFGKDVPLVQVKQPEPVGDGKAVFFGEPSDEEFKEFERKEQGMDKWYKRILR